LTAFLLILYTSFKRGADFGEPARPSLTIKIRRNPMCEVNAYIINDGKEELYLENVNVAKSEKGKVFLKNLFGEQKVYEGVIAEFSLPGHRIVLERK